MPRRRSVDEDGDLNANQIANLLTVLDRHQIQAVNSAAKEIRKNYSKKISEKLISLIRSTLRVLAKYFNSAVGEGQALEQKSDDEKYDGRDIVFVLITYLSIPIVEVRPSVDEVQSMLNNAGRIIISVNKGISQWKNIKKKNGKVPDQMYAW